MESNPDHQKKAPTPEDIEDCIQILDNYFADEEYKEEIANMLIDNTLPIELRSFFWKNFFGLIPKDSNDIFAICQAVNQTRKDYEALLIGGIAETIKKMINGILDDPILKQEVETITHELEKFSSQSDLFKSKSTIQTICKLYFLWKHYNKIEGFYLQPLYILTTIVYAFHQTILKESATGMIEIKTKEQATTKNLFYLINNEDYFEADAYNFFSTIMKEFKIMEQIIKYKTVTPLDFLALIKEAKAIDNDITTKEYIDQLDLQKKLSFGYISLLSNKPLKVFASQNFDPFPIQRDWYTFFFTNIFLMENVIYLWNNIFLEENKEEIAGCIIASFVKVFREEILESESKEQTEAIFKDFPQHRSDLEAVKHYCKKARKICDKIYDE